MPGLRIWQGCQYVKVAQGEDYTGCWICLNKPEYLLIIMSQDVWICLYNAEYDWKCQHIPEKYARILNVSDVVHTIRSLYKLLGSYWDRDVFRTQSNIFSMECLAKRQGRVELGHFNTQYTINKSKRGSAGKHLEVFFPIYS